MAKRYSGNLQISVVYDDRGHYRTAVSSGGKLLWRGTVNPAPAGFGPGIAYDSPKAYDEVASSALAFADDEKRDIADKAEFDEDLTGYLIRRSPRAKASSSHATKKHPTIQVGDCVVMRDPHRKFITSSTGGDVFKVVGVSGVTLTIEGPVDWHPKHRRQKVMGAHQFKRVACPRSDRSGDNPSTRQHATRRKSPPKRSAKIQVGDLVRYKSGYGGTYVVVAIEGDRAKIKSVEGYKGVGATTDLADLWKYR